MIQYSNFYRDFVVRRENQLQKPPLPVLARFELPPLSMTHFVPESPTNLWPTEDWYMYNKNQKHIRIKNHTDLFEPVGGPKLVSDNWADKVRIFRTQNPRFKLAIDLEDMKREEKVIVTQNYGLLLARWKYQRSTFSAMNRWTNVFNTMFKSVGENVGSGYDQYIELTMPKVLPKRSVLIQSENGWTTRNMPLFNNYTMLMLHHLWVWIGENRSKGMIAKHFPKGYKGVHIVLRESDRFSVVSLEMLDRWRKPSVEQMREFALALKADPKADKPTIEGKYSPTEMQKLLLRLMLSVTSARSGVVDENLGGDSVVENTTSGSDEGTVVVKTPAGQVDDGEQTEEQAFAGYDEEADRANLMAEVDKDLDALDQVGTDTADETTTDEFSETDDINAYLDESVALPAQKAEEEGTVVAAEFFPEDPVDGLKAMCNKAAEDGNISAAEFRRLQEMSELVKDIPAPLGAEGTLADFIKIKPEEVAIDPNDPEIQIPDRNTITDKSMLQSSLQVMDKRYAEKVLQKDVAAMVFQLQAAGVVIKSYDVREVEDITGVFYEYTVQVKAVDGASSTMMFRLPKVESDGNFKINGVNYRLRKQRGDMPIRKIGSSRVALTSYYGKVNIYRSERRVNDYYKWLCNAIRAAGLDPKNQTISALVPGKAFGPDMTAPRLYSAIGHSFRSFNLQIAEEVFVCSWDPTKAPRLKMAGPMAGALLVGTCAATGSRLLMDLNSNLVIADAKNVLSQAPRIEELLGLNVSKSPVEYAEVKVFAKMVPLGVVLGYLLGFEQLLGLLKPTGMRIVPTGKRVSLVGDEWSIVFDDKTYVFSRSDALVTMVLGGWREFYQTTSRYPAEEFNKQDVYFNLFEDAKLGVRTQRELDLLQSLFIDPITRDLLREMKEPVVFTKLLLRAGELLVTDEHPNEQDTRYMRIKGYERFAGAAYAEMVRSVRIHNSRPGKHRYGLELNPYAVWINIQQDPAKDQVSEINPIQNLKEQEAVTYSGTGGRNSRSMVKGTRIYHENDKGLISESTVDSGDVAINVFTSGNPLFNSLRGTADKFDFQKNGATALLSTSALLSPGSTKDDPKRVNFIGIQNRHVVACEGYTQPHVRTGYEQVVPHRVGDMFAVTAKKPGKVVSRTDDGIIVEYEDGTRQGVTLGRRFGNASGLTIPHQIHSDLKEGDTFAVGNPLAWNTGFFERDALDPKQIIMKSATMCRVALMESPDTLEDSSAISASISRKLNTEQVKIKDIIVNFDQAVHRMVKEGEKVEPESILCFIEDEISARANSAGLDDETLDTLRVLGAQTPQAKVQGKIDRIEIFYNGELEDMSDSLRALVKLSDKRIAARNVAIGRKAFTGSVGMEFRIGSDPLMMDTACIRVYMSALVPAGVGDKGVLCNQMKTVFGRVFPDNVRTESGKPIDVIFGAMSVDARIVTSPFLIGTTTTLLMVGAKRIGDAYYGRL